MLCVQNLQKYKQLESEYNRFIIPEKNNVRNTVNPGKCGLAPSLGQW